MEYSLAVTRIQRFLEEGRSSGCSRCEGRAEILETPTVELLPPGHLEK